MGLDHMRPAVAAQRARARIALLALQRPPAAHARRAHPEPLGGLPVGQALTHRGKNPQLEDRPKELSTCLPASRSGRHLNQKIAVGIPQIQSARLLL